ncbi:MAG TPA: UvrD-helicase domain-containing protein, partial [Polyangiaceae bacterium]|nr:UvrD-helicase domain-containing protein [Polyangiaceae bacterium]
MSQVAPTSAEGLRLVSASAGSGKTYRLTEEVTRAVDPSARAPIDIEGLVGVTYTTKAHAELEARIRRVLVKNRAFDCAQRLPLAHVGTVHAVCLRILKEFALDAGLSPTIDVIPANECRRLLQAALEQALDPALHRRLEMLAIEFQFERLPRTGRYDWVTPVDDIMTLARSNRIPPAALPQMARRSIEGLSALLPPAERSGTHLEAALGEAIHVAIEKLAQLDDGTKASLRVLRDLRTSAWQLKSQRLTWGSWARLTDLAPAKRALAVVAPVQEAAASYERHPQFQAGLRELTEHVFEAARVGLLAYTEWK